VEEERTHYRYLVENTERRDHGEDEEVDGWITLTCIFERWKRMVWGGSVGARFKGCFLLDVSSITYKEITKIIFGSCE
jgi:hypothetical protein